MSATVLVLINGLHAKTGGGVNYLRHLVPELALEEGLEVRLCLHESQRGLFGGLGDHAPIHWVDFSDGFLRRLAWEQMRLPGLARAIGADVTFSPANFGPLLAPRPVLLLRNALAVSAEDRRPGKQLYWAALSLMTWASLAGCRRAIAVSDYAGRALAGRHAAKVAVVHHGVDALFHADDSPRGDFLLTVGDLYVQKNLLRLVEALGPVRERFPGLKLKVAGRRVDDEYAAQVDARIRALGLEETVEMLGHVAPAELAGLYRTCALFLFPSTVETFGNPLVEAMASGAPVLSADAAAMPEVAGDAALYFDPYRPDDMAEKIIHAMGDELLRRDLSRRGLARAREFSWKRTAADTADILRAAALDTPG